MTFRDMRRQRQQLTADESLRILQRGTSGVLALAGDGGYPYAVPLSYVCSGSRLYFHSAREGHKIDAIRGCDKASFCVVERDEVRPQEYTTYYRSAIAFGHIAIVEVDGEKREALRLIGERYNPGDEAGLRHELDKGMAHVAILRLDIEHLTGKEAIELTRGRAPRQDNAVESTASE